MKKILICDDVFEDAKRWSDTVNQQCPKGFRSQPVQPTEFSEAVAHLENRRLAAREAKRVDTSSKECLFDSADIVVLDYDLLSATNFVSGEEVAYLCRSYSRCGLIVGLNQYVTQFGRNYFDLTLKGHPESFADLNISDDQLANPGLWKECWIQEPSPRNPIHFRPWYWPLLPALLDAFRLRTKEISSRLDDRIIHSLKLDEEIVTLPRSTKEFLGPRDPEETSFTEFVKRSGNGLRAKDEPFEPGSIARIAAARLSKWLERLILSAQDVLVDAPHLVSRYPSLLKGGLNGPRIWNRTTSFSRDKTGLNLTPIHPFEFPRPGWLSRPAWFWKKLSSSEKIKEVTDPWTKLAPNFVFCEDISRFVPVESAREFVANVPSPFVRRFVVKRGSKAARHIDVEDVQYEPAVRFAI